MVNSLPPLSLAELVAEIEDPTFTSYVYIGAGSDKGWGIAKGAQKMIANVRVFRVAPAQGAEVRAEFSVPPSTVGIVFGFGRDVTARLNQATADDALKVFEAIWASDQ